MTLPQSWRSAPLGDLVAPTRPRHKPADYPHLPFIGMEHVEAHSMRLLGTVPARTMKSSAVHFQPGDVLYGRLRPYLNKVYRPAFEGLCSAEFIVLPQTSHVESRYLQYFLNSAPFVGFASHLNTGDRPRIDFEQLRVYQVPIPPLDEQRRIAAAIEEQISRLEAAVQSLSAAQVRVSALRKSVHHHMLGGEWSSVPLATVVDPNRPISYGILMPKENVAEGVPYVRVKDMKADGIDVEGLRRTSPAIAHAYRRSILRGGDVLVSIRGTYGRVAVVPSQLDGANITQDTARVAPGPMVLGAYLASVLRGPASQAYMRRVARGVAVKGVNLGDLKVLPIPLPPLDVQAQTNEAVQEQTDRIARIDAVITTALRRAKTLRQAILNAAFTGRLVKTMAGAQTDLVSQPEQTAIPVEAAR